MDEDSKGAVMTDRREAIADDLRALATDLKSLLESATTNPKARAKKEWCWRLLSTAFGIATTAAARKGAAKVWGILTGEEPPTKGPAQPAKHGR
jgi:Protein of unknown function (DUF4235)